MMGGSLFQHPPTEPSRSMNTWLLGVWEHRNEDGTSFRAGVMPYLSDRYMIYYRRFDKSGRSVSAERYEAWISRVGRISLLTVAVPRPEGMRYDVIGIQLLSPQQIRALQPEIDPDPVSSFRMRVDIRRKFKRGELFGGVDQTWSKIGEVYWRLEEVDGVEFPADPTNQPLLPLSSTEVFMVEPGE